MNTVIILAGGTGTRMHMENDVPKQYLAIKEKAIIEYCLAAFNEHCEIEKIVIAADNVWHSKIEEWLEKDNIYKFAGFSEPGKTRQQTIYNGLCYCETFMNNEDLILIHDAARPYITRKIITDCIHISKEYDGAMPVIKMKNTVYQSVNGTEITGLLNREEIYAGQTPESFLFGKYIQAFRNTSIEALDNMKGSSEVAYKNGMRIEVVEGDERNIKITVPEDLELFCFYLGEQK